MEEDGRRKKNKKKKNKQANRLTESVTVGAGESISDNQTHVSKIGQDNDPKVSGTADASNDVGGKMDADRDGHFSNGIEEVPTHLAKAEKQDWLDREASFQEKIKQLQAEKDAQIQKEAILEEKIKELLKEKDENLQKLASQEVTIKQLRDEKISSAQKEASLKENLGQLEKDKDALIQKEDRLEEKIKQLQREKDAYLQTEDLAKESISGLNNDNKRLQDQVMELEELRKNLLEEKQELTENVSSLQLQINNLGSTITFPHSNMDNKVTSEEGGVDYRGEVACALVGKLVPENAELVEKVTELCAELDQKGVRTEDSLSVGSYPGSVAARSADATDSSNCPPNFAVGAEANKILPASGSTQVLEEIIVEDERNGEHVNEKDGSGLANSSEDIIEADEIVQIPLYENEVEDTNLEVAAQKEEKTDVSFTDAPLIGAPFRLISFVARYVSGSDLVNKNTGNSAY